LEDAPPIARRATRLIDAAVITLSCAIFLAICLYQLELPGLYTDEAFDVIPAMQIVLGHPVELLRGASLDILGVKLPLMSSSDYQGITSTYLAIPFFAVGGVNVISLRLMTVLVGVVALILAFFLARSWFGTSEARLTVLLLAVSPAWVFWSRLGVYVVSEVVPIATGALLAFTTWVRHRPLGSRNAPLYVGFFLLGLGLTTKLLFLWFIVAVALCALILWGRRLWDTRRVWSRQMGRWARIGAFAAIAFCVGAFPFLLYNLETRGTIQLIRSTLSRPGETSHGVDNAAFVRNLWTEADAFKVLLDGGYFWFQGELRIYANALTPTFFAISAIGLVAFVLASHARRSLQLPGIAAWGIVILTLACASAFLLAAGILGGSGMMLLTLLLIIAGTTLVTFGAIRKPESVSVLGWMLLAVTTLSGALWWFGGAGRPEGVAPSALLGLWPIDAAGILFWASGVGLTLTLALDPHPARHQRAITSALALIGLIVAQSTVTISGLWSTHLLVLLPLPQLVIAAFAVALGRRATGWLSGRARRPLLIALRVLPAVVIVGSILSLDLLVDYSYHRDLAKTGGGSTFSDAIYSLTDYLEARDDKVVAMDWGFRRPVQFLSHERVDPIEAYGLDPAPTPRFYETLREFLRDPNTLYLFHIREGTAYPRHDAFLAEAKAAGKTVVLERTFYHRNGLPVYEVYSVK
jgi:hypothetical protein